MRCEQCQDLIEEYYDIELDTETAAAVEVHLASCSSCAASLDGLKREHATYAAYERHVEVSPELWRRVHRKLLEDPPVGLPVGSEVWKNSLFRMPHVSAWVAMAAVAIAVGLTVAIMKYRGHATPESGLIANGLKVDKSKLSTNLPAIEETKTRESIALVEKKHSSSATRRSVATPLSARLPSQSNVPRAGGSPEQLVREAEAKYLAAIAMLSRNVEQHRSQLDPKTRMEFSRALAAIDRAIAGTRQAVRQNPEDPVAVQYMLTAYAKKVDVLREMTNY